MTTEKMNMEVIRENGKIKVNIKGEVKKEKVADFIEAGIVALLTAAYDSGVFGDVISRISENFYTKESMEKKIIPEDFDFNRMFG